MPYLVLPRVVQSVDAVLVPSPLLRTSPGSPHSVVPSQVTTNTPFGLSSDAPRRTTRAICWPARRCEILAVYLWASLCVVVC